MSTLFRFIVRRPKSEVPEEAVIDLARPDSALQRDLGSAMDGENPAASARAAALSYVEQGDFAPGPEASSFGEALIGLDRRVREMDGWPDSDTLRADLTEALGAPPSQVVSQDDFQSDRSRVADSIIAIKLLRSKHGLPVADLAQVLRWLELVSALAAGAEVDVVSWLRRPLRLPREIFPLPSVAEAAPEPAEPADDGRQQALDKARGEVKELRKGIRELLETRPEDLQVGSSQAPPEPPPPLRTPGLATRFFGLLFGSRTESSLRISGSADGSPPRPAGMLALGDEAAGRLSESTRQVLALQSVDPTRMAVDRSVERLQAVIGTKLWDIAQLREQNRRATVRFLGRIPVRIGIGLSPGIGGAAEFDRTGVPDSHGTIESVGEAELMLVKQQLIGYEARDVAHIENVLRGENKTRVHRRLNRTEDFEFLETERSEDSEREHETADRFEMQREAQEVLKEDASLQAGLKVSAKYGPVVEVEASASGSISSSREQSVRQATEFSSEVTSRSASRITERFLQRNSTRRTREAEETNTHILDNVGGDGHISGVYQWVEKIYQAQVFNYGERTLYDLMVPEPAAFYIASLEAGFAEASVTLEPPEPFTLTPDRIDEDDYHEYVLEYGATDVAPPPENHITITKEFHTAAAVPRDDPSYGTSAVAAELTLKEGYQAIAATVVTAGGQWSDFDGFAIDITVGQKSLRMGAPQIRSEALDLETRSMPVAVFSLGWAAYTVSIEVLCQRTEREMNRWRHATHAALLQAYERKRSEYEEKLAAAMVRAEAEIAGRHPAANRTLEQTELKKGCISILTRQHFRRFDAINEERVEMAGRESPMNVPTIDFTEAELEGDYLRFFEHAFEWEHITYVFYPYFWGRRETWLARMTYEDVDPLFERFLKSGFARVVLPVRPGFQGQVAHFMDTGETWGGGDPSVIASDTYLPIVEEQSIQLGAPGNEVPVGEPWEVRVPTTLVQLRADDALPAWTQDEDGNWVPVEPARGDG